MTQDIGFRFYPAPTEYPFGHRQLEVHMVAQPTLHHYDPERVDFIIASLDGGRDKLTISYGWQGPRNYRVCLGRIALHDRREKVVEAFSFGGELTITQEEDVVQEAIALLKIRDLWKADGPSLEDLLASS